MMRYIRFKKSFEHIHYEAPPLALSGNAFLPSRAYIPLLQSGDSKNNALVSCGERVGEGQLLVRGNGQTTAHVHSSIPGIVRDFRLVPLPDGRRCRAAVIELSGSFDILGRKEAAFPWRNIPESEILRVLEEKGIINTFEGASPLAPFIRSAKKNGGSSLVLRLFDADPTCQLDSFLARHDLDMILEGTALLAKALDTSSVFLIHDQKQWTGPAQKELDERFQKRKVRLIRTDARYPSGNLSSLQALVPDKRNLCIDPVTAISAFEAVVRNQPMLYRYVAITGPAIDSPAILKVRIGTPIGDVIEECGGFKTDPGRIVVNGLLTGHAVYDLDTPITKNTKSIHIMDFESCPSYKVRECIHCGRCLQVCPVGIDPMNVVIGVQKENFSDVKLLSSIEKCHHCGCCAIVCPSRIPLHHIIRESRNRIKGTKE